MAYNSYRAYGLRIDAEIACPELQPDPHPDGEPDVTVRLLPAVESVSETVANGFYEVQPEVFRMTVPGVGQYLVEQGSRISIEPLANAHIDEVRLFLLGSSMGALLYQRGLFPLHGSAIETKWGAMIFVGTQGAGKSTLAAQFHHRGYRLLSDDICAVACTPEGLRALPAVAQFRLCSDAYERIGAPQQARFDVDKFVVPMGDGYCTQPVELKAIHILCNHEQREPQFTLLRGFDRVQQLLENLYRPHYLKGQNTQSDLMRMAGLIAQKCTMVSVTRNRDASAIDAMIGFLEGAWTKEFGLVPELEKR